MDPLAQDYITFSSESLFPAPWEDYVSRRIPVTYQDALYWCEYVALANQTLFSALKKLVSFYITELEFSEVTHEEAEKLKDYFYNVLSIDNVLHAIGMDFLVYGNSFVTPYFPIERSIVCPGCSFGTVFFSYASDKKSEFKYERGKFILTCSKCGYRGAWKIKDQISNKTDDVSIIRWNPHDIIINFDPLSQKSQYLWKISPEYKTLINKGGVLQLAYAPLEVLEGIDNNSEILLDDDRIIHLKEQTLSGVRVLGWGLSPILANFRQTWYIEILRRANLAIAYDFIVPLRILTPEPRSGAQEFGDPLMVSKFDSVNANLESIIASWRKEPTGWYSCPFPVRYQPLGAEGGRIIPAPLMDQANVELISSLGMPVDFYRGTLSMQAAPFALRILEGNWLSLNKLFNKFLQKLAYILSSKFRWDTFKVRLIRPTYMDDVNKQMAKLQLAMNNIISKTTGLRSIGLNYLDELNRQIEEQELEAKKFKELQERVEDTGLTDQLATQNQQEGGMGDIFGALGGLMSGALPPQGTPPEAGGAQAQFQQMDPVAQVLAAVPETSLQPISPSDIMNSASQIAQMLFNMHPSFRLSALRKLKQKNELIHAVASSKLQELYRNAELQGKVQAQQAAASNPSPPYNM